MIIVTGAAGFVGSNICRALRENGLDVLGIDDLSFGDIRNLPEGLNCHRIRFQQFTSFDRNSILVHCATSNIIYGMKHPVETFKNNAEDTIELFNRFPGKIVYLSTSSVYGNAEDIPTPETTMTNTYNAYDTSKRIAELYLKKRGNYTTLRLTNNYGPNQRVSNPYCGVMAKIIVAGLEGGEFKRYGSGESTRDYVYVEDTARAVVAAVLNEARNTEINIGTGRETSVNSLVRWVGEALGCHVRSVVAPERAIDRVTRRCLDIRRAYNLLGWSPQVTIGEGIVKTIEWQMKNP